MIKHCLLSQSTRTFTPQWWEELDAFNCLQPMASGIKTNRTVSSTLKKYPGLLTSWTLNNCLPHCCTGKRNIHKNYFNTLSKDTTNSFSGKIYILNPPPTMFCSRIWPDICCPWTQSINVYLNVVTVTFFLEKYRKTPFGTGDLNDDSGSLSIWDTRRNLFWCTVIIWFLPALLDSLWFEFFYHYFFVKRRWSTYAKPS